MLLPSILALGFAFPSAFAQAPGTFVVAGNTLVSAMMVRRPFYLRISVADSLINPRCLSVVQTRSTFLTKWKATPNKLTAIPLTLQFGGWISVSYVFG